jgi:hypothetical protein
MEPSMSKRTGAPARRLKAKKQAKARVGKPKRRISFKSDAWYSSAVQRFGIKTGGAPAGSASPPEHSDRQVIG